MWPVVGPAKSDSGESVGRSDPEFDRLAELWPSLNADVRGDILAMSKQGGASRLTERPATVGDGVALE